MSPPLILVALTAASAAGFQPLRVLTFGDSLTCGLVDRNRYAPYADVLREQLGASLTMVESEGIVMESAHAMPQRLTRVLASRDAYDAIIVLGGSNDLWKGDADAICDSLAELHDPKLAWDLLLFDFTKCSAWLSIGGNCDSFLELKD